MVYQEIGLAFSVLRGVFFGENRNGQLFLFRLIKKCKGSLPEQAEMIPI